MVAMLPGTTFPATVKHARHIEGAGGEKHTETRCAASSLKGSLSHDVFLKQQSSKCQRFREKCVPMRVSGKRGTALQSFGGLAT